MGGKWGWLCLQRLLNLQAALLTRRRMPGYRHVTVPVSGQMAKGVRKPVNDNRGVLASRQRTEFSQRARWVNAGDLHATGAEGGTHCLGDDYTVPQEV